jgi:hypothetical protein
MSASVKEQDKTLFTQLIGNYRRFLETVARKQYTVDGHPESVFPLAVNKYRDSIELTRRWLDAALNKAAQEYLDELSNSDTNLAVPGPIGECNKSPVRTWAIF